MNRSPVTKKGIEKVRQQLGTLKTVDRPAVIRAIAEARAHGDLSENAEYHAARERQSFIEARINQLESALSGAQVVDVPALNGTERVVFGATVDLLRVDDETSVCYQIVGEVEADADHGLISILSPIARALLGKETGEVLEVYTPGGKTAYEIVGIRYE